jgi:hypothetical protein
MSLSANRGVTLGTNGSAFNIDSSTTLTVQSIVTGVGALTKSGDGTLVLTGTVLAEWYRQGTYTPLSLEEAVSWCTPAYEAFLRAQIPIARLGLHPDPELQEPGRIIAGPFHPAFGYLVRVEWWKERLDRHLEVHQKQTRGKAITLWVADGALSEVIGPARSNIRHWLEKWLFSEVKVQGAVTQLPGEFDYSLN